MNKQQEFEAWWDKWHDPHVGRVENTVKKFAAESAWQARAALAANEKQPNRATDIATALALPGCERLKEWAEIGPVQRAAVEEFAYALAAKVPADLRGEFEALAVQLSTLTLERDEAGRYVSAVQQMLWESFQVRRAAMSEANSLAAKVPADPCPGCRPGIVCRTPSCGRLKLRATTAPAPEAAKVPDDPCLVLWKAMNQAGKVGNRTDDKLIVKFLREAGYCIAATPAPAPEAERQALRYAQAGAVMPLIGPLLDAWENVTFSALDDAPELAKCLSEINKAMEGAEAEPAQAQQAAELERMTAHRAAFFMERFLKEEKMLGPNEQAALRFVIAQLEAKPEAQQPHRYILELPNDDKRTARVVWSDRKEEAGKITHSLCVAVGEAKPEAQQPLTDGEINDAALSRSGRAEFVAGFYSGARFAEAACAEQWGVKLGASGEASNG